MLCISDETTAYLLDEQAEEQGFVPRDDNGRPLKTLTMGATIARRASDAVYQKFMAGEMTAEEAYAEAAKGQPGGVSFALEEEHSPETKSVRSCVEELASGKKEALLENTAWGKNIVVPQGKIGEKGKGIKHIQEKRVLHGLTIEEASFIAVCALKAAESVKTPERRGSAYRFDRFGVRAVVSNNNGKPHEFLTGFVINTNAKAKRVKVRPPHSLSTSTHLMI